MSRDWPLVIAGVVGSLVVAPVLVYHLLVVEESLASGGSVLALGLLALVPRFLMGGIGLWMAARG